MIKGNHIYYFALKKKDWYGGKADGTIKGIYRMNLNGTGKKVMVAFPKGVYESTYSDLGVINKNTFIYSQYDYPDNRWYISQKGKKSKKRYKGRIYTNMTLGMLHYRDFKSYTRVKVNGKLYSANGNKLYVTKNKKKNRLAKVKGDIEKILVSGNQILLITGVQNNGDHYYVYLLEKNGHNLQRVQDGANVSGGWGH